MKFSIKKGSSVPGFELMSVAAKVLWMSSRYFVRVEPVVNGYELVAFKESWFGFKFEVLRKYFRAGDMVMVGFSLPMRFSKVALDWSIQGKDGAHSDGDYRDSVNFIDSWKPVKMDNDEVARLKGLGVDFLSL